MKYIKKIEGDLIDNISGNVNYVKTVSAEIQVEDYVNVFGFTGFLQNFTNIEQTEAIDSNTLGVLNTLNLETITLEISY